MEELSDEQMARIASAYRARAAEKKRITPIGGIDRYDEAMDYLQAETEKYWGISLKKREKIERGGKLVFDKPFTINVIHFEDEYDDVKIVNPVWVKLRGQKHHYTDMLGEDYEETDWNIVIKTKEHKYGLQFANEADWESNHAVFKYIKKAVKELKTEIDLYMPELQGMYEVE